MQKRLQQYLIKIRSDFKNRILFQDFDDASFQPPVISQDGGDLKSFFSTRPGPLKPSLLVDRGFTLLEIVVVMAIIAAGLVVVFYGMNAILPEQHLKSAVRHLKSDLHLARLIAIKQNNYVVVEFNTDADSYSIYIDDGGADRANANNYCRDEGERIIKTRKVHPHVNIYRAQFGSVPGKFAFNSRGTLDGLAGGIYMQNKISSYRGLTVSRIGKLTIKTSVDGSHWHRVS